MTWEAGGDLHACAQIVERGDPDRFACAMAAPLSARVVLFPIYAFNVEVSRAPWLTQEPMIAQMRLQWWLDVLDEIEAGGFVRRHEVVTPLAQALAGMDLGHLRALVRARELDVERAPFADDASLRDYLDRTTGGLTMTALAALGAPGSRLPEILPWSRAAALARYLQAVPELEARGRLPLPDGRPEAVARLAKAHLEDLRATPGLRRMRRSFGPAGAALREFGQARALLRSVVRDPGGVAEGRLILSEFQRRWRLLTA
jgi:phytoene/squalene synthetase